MAELGVLKDARIWLGAYEITASMNAVSLRHAVDVKDNTVLGLDTRSEAAGLRTVEARASGLYAVDATSTATYESDDILSANLAVADTPISFGVETGAAGEVGYTFESLQTVYEWGAPVGDLPGYDMNASARGTPLIRGTILFNLSAAASGAWTAYEVGSVSATQKGYAALHVLAASAGDTLDVTVQSDTAEGFPSSATQITFAQVSAIGSQWMTVDGPITDTWWRVGYTIAGSDPSFTWVTVFGIY